VLRFVSRLLNHDWIGLDWTSKSDVIKHAIFEKREESLKFLRYFSRKPRYDYFRFDGRYIYFRYKAMIDSDKTCTCVTTWDITISGYGIAVSVLPVEGGIADINAIGPHWTGGLLKCEEWLSLLISLLQMITSGLVVTSLHLQLLPIIRYKAMLSSLGINIIE